MLKVLVRRFIMVLAWVLEHMAAKLRRWVGADSSLQDITGLSESSAVIHWAYADGATESADESVPTNGPPAHWLAVVRRHAPSLLRPAYRSYPRQYPPMQPLPQGLRADRQEPAASSAAVAPHTTGPGKDQPSVSAGFPTVMPIHLGAPMDENPLRAEPTAIFTATPKPQPVSAVGGRQKVSDTTVRTTTGFGPFSKFEPVRPQTGKEGRRLEQPLTPHAGKETVFKPAIDPTPPPDHRRLDSAGYRPTREGQKVEMAGEHPRIAQSQIQEKNGGFVTQRQPLNQGMQALSHPGNRGWPPLAEGQTNNEQAPSTLYPVAVRQLDRSAPAVSKAPPAPRTAVPDGGGAGTSSGVLDRRNQSVWEVASSTQARTTHRSTGQPSRKISRAAKAPALADFSSIDCVTGQVQPVGGDLEDRVWESASPSKAPATYQSAQQTGDRASPPENFSWVNFAAGHVQPAGGDQGKSRRHVVPSQEQPVASQPEVNLWPALPDEVAADLMAAERWPKLPPDLWAEASWGERPGVEWQREAQRPDRWRHWDRAGAIPWSE